MRSKPQFLDILFLAPFAVACEQALPERLAVAAGLDEQRHRDAGWRKIFHLFSSIRHLT